MKSLKISLLSALIGASLIGSALADGANTQGASVAPGIPDRGYDAVTVAVDPAVLATGERVKDLSKMTNPLPN